jgi:hypothetical protein
MLRPSQQGGLSVDKVLASVNPAILSKINWTQVVGIAASVGAVFGLHVDDATKVVIVTAIQGVVSLLTVIFRTYFTAKPPGA